MTVAFQMAAPRAADAEAAESQVIIACDAQPSEVSAEGEDSFQSPGGTTAQCYSSAVYSDNGQH